MFLFKNHSEPVTEFPTSFIKKDDFEFQCVSTHVDKGFIDKIKPWGKHIPSDKARVDKIRQYYISYSRTMVDGILYVWNTKNQYFIYDGLHRLEAALLVGFEMTMIIGTYHTTREKDIIDHFLTLNRGISVSSLYLDSPDTFYRKQVSESVVRELVIRYPYFVSSSRKPYPCHFHREDLMEWISTFHIPFKKHDIVSMIVTALLELNAISKQKYKNDSHVPLKCLKHNFYLFLLEESEIQSYVELQCNEK